MLMKQGGIYEFCGNGKNMQYASLTQGMDDFGRVYYAYNKTA